MKTAIITGASSGIGKEFAKFISQEGSVDEIWAIARNESKLRSLLDEVKFPIKLLSMDVSDRNDIKKFESILAQEKPEIYCLINSAGQGKFCSWKDLSIDESADIIQLNCIGLVSITLAALPYIMPGGNIINMSSAASFQPLPYENIYGASKAFVTNYSRALNRELKNHKITVTSVCPSWVQTNFLDLAHTNGNKVITNYKGICTADKVVKQAMMDAYKGKDISVYGHATKFEQLMSKLLPFNLVMNAWMKRQKLI